MDLNSKKNSTFVVIGIAVLLGLVLVFQWVLADDSYLIEMKQVREKRQEMMKTDFDSPIPDSLKPHFKGIDFFPVDKAWRFNGTFEENSKFQRIKLPRTDGKADNLIIAGWVRFKYRSKKYKLTCYQPNPDDSNVLFIPFRDATSGKSSYGGGRYLDTRRADDRIDLDFNKAYNPYCVYDYAGFACTVPPEENNLPIAIEAGEKTFDWGGLQ